MYEDTKHAGLEADNQYIQFAAEVLPLFSDETRIRIVLVLCTGECSVNELAKLIGRSPTAVLQYLAKLCWCKVVQPRQEGVHIYYSFIGEHTHELVMHAVFQAEHVMEIAPPYHMMQDSEAAFEEKTQERSLQP